MLLATTAVVGNISLSSAVVSAYAASYKSPLVIGVAIKEIALDTPKSNSYCNSFTSYLVELDRIYISSVSL